MGTPKPGHYLPILQAQTYTARISETLNFQSIVLDSLVCPS